MFLLSSPVALLGLISLPLLTAVYLLRNRLRNYPVSSIILWQRISSARLGGKTIDRPRLPLIFFLELLILFLITAGAAGPVIRLTDSRAPLIVVLDNSISMKAATGEQTFRDRAVDEILATVDFSRFRSITLILAGTEPVLLGSGSRETAGLKNDLEKWTCTAPRADISKAVALAGNLQGRVLVISDHKPPEEKPPAGLVWKSVGAPLPNRGFINASLTRYGSKLRCFLEIQNFSTTRLAFTCTVNKTPRNCRLSAGEKKRIILEITDTKKPVTATLPADAYAEDDTVVLYPPPLRRVSVGYTIADAELKTLLKRTVTSTGLSRVIAAQPDLLFTDAKALSTTDRDCWTVRFDTGEAGKVFRGPYVMDRSHPLLDGISLDNAIWGVYRKSNPLSIPLVTTGSQPLISAESLPWGAQRLHLNLNAELSNIHRSAAWPGLIWNLLHWRSLHLPGLQRTAFRLGEKITVITERDTKQITVHQTGTPPKPCTPVDRTVIFRPRERGVYTITRAKKKELFAVNALCAEESDLRNAASGSWGEWEQTETASVNSAPLAPFFFLLAFAALILHCFLTRNRSSAAARLPFNRPGPEVRE